MRDVIALHVLVTSLGVALGVLYPFISVILAGRGFSPAEIGLISSLGAFGFTIAVPAWGHLADVRFGRPRTLQLCAIGAGSAVLALLLPWPPLLVVALLIAFWVFESSWQPLADAITVNALRGRDYARVRLFTSLGFAVATILSGFLYDRTGYWPAFVLFALAGGVMLIASLFLPDVDRADLAAHRRRAAAAAAPATPETPEAPETSATPKTRTWGFGSAGVAFAVAPKLGLVLAASALLHVGIISGFTFLPLRIVELGGSPSDVALSAGLSAGSEIPAMLVMGAAVRWFGLRAVFAGSALLYGACFLSWTVIEVPLVIIATRVLTGLAFSGVIIAVVMTIARLLPADLQATGQALFQTSAFGVAAVLANVVGGVLYQSFGHAAVFTMGAALAVIAAGIGWVAFPHGTRSPSPSVVRQSGA
jgi:PPP family 3-phenylpropionic acid transporter